MMASEIVRASAQMATASRRRDYRTSALTAAVIALAVLLGWMVGRVGWSMAVNRVQPQTSAARDLKLPAAHAAQKSPAHRLDHILRTKSPP